MLCEDHGVPYIFVSSRAELGAAGMTKRPTSVVLVGRTAAAKKAAKGKEGEKGEKDDMVQEKDGGGAGEWEEVYADLVKVVRKAGRGVRI